jgi:peptidoglycan/xylan/chitin deacetylase (PgdA/CDA1 family)
MTDRSRTDRRRPRRLVALALAGTLFVGACGATASPTPVPSSSQGPSAPPSARPSPSPTASPSPTPLPSPTPVEYEVRAGDNLTSVARRYDTTARSIAYWNRDTYPSLDPDSPEYEPDRIEVGWRLRLWPGQTVDEASPPPGASPTPRPSLSIPPTTTPIPSGASLLVDHGPRQSNAVALTFDLGGRTDPALSIVDWLIEHGIEATVFPTGEIGASPEGRAVLERVATRPDLFSIGNHSWDHPDFRDLDPAAMASQLDRTETAIDGLIGRSTKPFFRPPEGGQDRETLDTVGPLGWSYTVLWDIDTADWRPVADGGPTASDIVARVLARAQGGSIVLMHLGGYNTLEALPGIVDGLRARGLEPVTIARLLGAG